jgi:DNA primase
VQCPFCDDHSNHCGVNPIKSRVACWRCGHHYLDQLIAALLGVSYKEAKEIIKEYSSDDLNYSYTSEKKRQNKSVSLPKGTGELQQIHINYLLQRNYDPEEIKKVWGIKGTGPIGEYNFRIIIPITFENKLVSYQGRDVTERSSLRYMACKPEEEVVLHKNILYGLENIKDRKGIIVEGAFDVWRIGEGALATFGTSYRNRQITCIKKYLDQAFLLFDPGDIEAQKKAKGLARSLASLKVKTELIELPEADGKDPGDLSPDEGKYLRKFLIGY